MLKPFNLTSNLIIHFLTDTHVNQIYTRTFSSKVLLNVLSFQKYKELFIPRHSFIGAESIASSINGEKLNDKNEIKGTSLSPYERDIYEEFNHERVLMENNESGNPFKFRPNNKQKIMNFDLNKISTKVEIPPSQKFYQIHTANNHINNENSHLKNQKLTGSSRKWMIRHLKDPYVKMASAMNYRARSAFKLIEIGKKFDILTQDSAHNQFILDCGAAPGAWSQVLVEGIKETRTIVAIDINYFSPISGVVCMPFQDINDPFLIPKIFKNIAKQHPSSAKAINYVCDSDENHSTIFDIILSDMAPNASGIKSLDHDVITALCLKAFLLCPQILKPGGAFVCKIWDGCNAKELVTKLGQSFEIVKKFKPACSRDESSETFLVCKSFKPNK